MSKRFHHIVPDGINGVRLSDYLAGIYPGLDTKSGVKKAIKLGEIFVQGKPASTGKLLYPGYCIEWEKPDHVPEKVYRIALDVVYEDDYLAIVNKPPGIVVSGNRFKTLENGIGAHISPSKQPDALTIPRAIHRLDSSTSGLVIIAKTQSVRIALGTVLEERKIVKIYHAVVIGQPSSQSVFNTPINGKEALTRFETVRSVPSLVSGRLTLLRLFPETGRTHQIRIHLSGAGFPILGDKIYGQPGFILKGKGLFLCATGVEFVHPVTGQLLSVSVDIPSKFGKFMDGEYLRWKKYSPDTFAAPGE